MAKRPNLLFVFSDQQSFDMISPAGLRQVHTPVAEQLAEEGVMFRHGVTNCPVCTPARGMLITGQHPLYHRAAFNDIQLIPDPANNPGLGHILRDAGYRMGYSGKWHLYGGERDRPIPPGEHRHGFDDYFRSNNCHVNFDPDHAYAWTHDAATNDEANREMFNRWEVEGQTDHAIEFLETQPDDQPFCLFVSYHAPHNHGGGDMRRYSQYDAPEEFKALYDVDDIDVRPGTPDTEEERLKMLGYSAMCSEVDHHLGRILETLKARGFDEDTLVVFTSDHGDNLGSHASLYRKTVPEDVSVRVPLLMRFPGRIPTGRTSDLLISLLDLPATLLSLMGFGAPEHFHGRDLAEPIVNRDDDAVQSIPLFNFQPTWRGVYTRRYTYAYENVKRDAESIKRLRSTLGRKAIRNFNVLYDRVADPYSLNNRFNDNALLDRLLELETLTYQWNDWFGDPVLTREQLFEAIDQNQGRPIDAIGEPACTGPRPD